MNTKKFNYLLIKELASKKEIQVKELSDKVGIPKGRLYKITGGYSIPKYSEIEKLSAFFNKSPDDFYSLSEDIDNENLTTLYKDTLYMQMKEQIKMYEKIINSFISQNELAKLTGNFRTAVLPIFNALKIAK